MSKKTKRLEKENLNLTRKQEATNKNIFQMAEERSQSQQTIDRLTRENEKLKNLCRAMQSGEYAGVGSGVAPGGDIHRDAQGRLSIDELEGETDSEYEDDEEYDEDEDEEEGEYDDEDDTEDEHGLVDVQPQPRAYGPPPPPPPPPPEDLMNGKLAKGAQQSQLQQQQAAQQQPNGTVVNGTGH